MGRLVIELNKLRDVHPLSATSFIVETRGGDRYEVRELKMDHSEGIATMNVVTSAVKDPAIVVVSEKTEQW